MMTLGRIEMEKFNGTNYFNLWRIKLKAWLVHQGLLDAIFINRVKALSMNDNANARESMMKAHSALL